MESAVISSDFVKEAIQPREKILRYQELLQEDITRLLSDRTLNKTDCPIPGDRDVVDSFTKLGMKYNISGGSRNIYISPRPTREQLDNFYEQSQARHFWLTDLWAHTKAERQKIIFNPLLDWITDRISEYLGKENVRVAEFFPNHWGYCLTANQRFPRIDYDLVHPLIESQLLRQAGLTSRCTTNCEVGSMDAVFLFEALERTVDPVALLQQAANSLKPGGLCFITCLLSSGFEVKVLGPGSDIFVPPERMNVLSYEGMLKLISISASCNIIEFSTPSVLDIPNVLEKVEETDGFVNYILGQRQSKELIDSLRIFLQRNRLGTFARLVLQKKKG